MINRISGCTNQTVGCDSQAKVCNILSTLGFIGDLFHEPEHHVMNNTKPQWYNSQPAITPSAGPEYKNSSELLEQIEQSKRGTRVKPLPASGAL